MIEVGMPAPSFSCVNHRGNQVTLEQFRGQTVVLWFYPKADTPGCKLQGLGFRDLQEEFEEKNAVILGISFDSVEENRAFATKYRFGFDLLCDLEREAALAYGACDSKGDEFARRVGVVVDTKGHIQEYHSSVLPSMFPSEVLARL